MKYLSLFSGIGGFELGIQQAYESKYNNRHATKQQSKKKSLRHKRDKSNIMRGDGNRWRTNPICIGYSEIDKYACQIYDKQFKHKNYGDITKINIQKLPDFDLLVGGFPCQSFSIAGKRKGFDDTRGTLFFDIARILAEKKPRRLVLENVKGLLSHDKGQTFQTILGVLSDMGYAVEWQVLNSKNFGVPQNRERVFIVGHLRGTSRPEVFPIGGTDNETNNTEGLQSDANPRELSRTLLARNYKDPKLVVRKIIDNKGKVTQRKVKEATKKGYAEAGVGDSINYSVPNSKTRRGRVGKGIANTLDTACNQGTLEDTKIRRLTPKECERLQGFPDDWTKEGTDGAISDTQRYKMCGNAVTVNVIKEIFKRL